MERPRPRPKHRSRANKHVAPSSDSPQSPLSPVSPYRDLTRPMPFAPLRIKRSTMTDRPAQSLELFESTSPESKESPLNVADINDMQSMDLPSPKRPNANDTLIMKLDILARNRTMKKSNHEQDINEIKEFISTQSKSQSLPKTAQNKVPTSLTMIGIRDPKSLLYHRQSANQLGHYRALTPEPVQPLSSSHRLGLTGIDSKYQHLRSASSVVAKASTAYDTLSTNADYVHHAQRREPSVIFGSLKSQKSLKEMLDLSDQEADEDVDQ